MGDAFRWAPASRSRVAATMRARLCFFEGRSGSPTSGHCKPTLTCAPLTEVLDCSSAVEGQGDDKGSFFGPLDCAGKQHVMVAEAARRLQGAFGCEAAKQLTQYVRQDHLRDIAEGWSCEQRFRSDIDGAVDGKTFVTLDRNKRKPPPWTLCNLLVLWPPLASAQICQTGSSDISTIRDRPAQDGDHLGKWTRFR